MNGSSAIEGRVDHLHVVVLQLGTDGPAEGLGQEGIASAVRHPRGAWREPGRADRRSTNRPGAWRVAAGGPPFGLGPCDRLRLERHTAEETVDNRRRARGRAALRSRPTARPGRARCTRRSACPCQADSNSRMSGSDQPAKTITCRGCRSNSSSITTGLPAGTSRTARTSVSSRSYQVAADAHHRQRLAVGAHGEAETRTR